MLESYSHRGRPRQADNAALKLCLLGKSSDFSELNGAHSRNRTSDTRIFNPLLYRLSYLGPDQSAFWRPWGGRLIRQGIGAVQRGLQEK